MLVVWCTIPAQKTSWWGIMAIHRKCLLCSGMYSGARVVESIPFSGVSTKSTLCLIEMWHTHWFWKTCWCLHIYIKVVSEKLETCYKFQMTPNKCLKMVMTDSLEKPTGFSDRSVEKWVRSSQNEIAWFSGFSHSSWEWAAVECSCRDRVL